MNTAIDKALENKQITLTEQQGETELSQRKVLDYVCECLGLPNVELYAVGGDTFMINGLISRDGQSIHNVRVNRDTIHNVQEFMVVCLDNSLRLVGMTNGLKLGSRYTQGETNPLKFKRTNKTYAELARMLDIVDVVEDGHKGYKLVLNDKGIAWIDDVIQHNLDLLQWQVQSPESKPKSTVSNVGLECAVCSEVMFVRLAQAKRISDNSLKAWKHCNKPVFIQEQFQDIVLT